MQAFGRRRMTVAPGGERVAGATGWPDALVVVERGEVELCCRGGTRARFAQGDVVWLTGLGLRTLRNPGPELAVLVAISRRDEFWGRRPSHGSPNRSR
jgi:hypothetical protein